MEKKFLTTPEVAERLGVSVRRVQQFINEGRLPSQQFGREHLIREADIALVAERRTGRPKKDADEAEPQPTKARAKSPAQSQPTKKRK